MRRALAWARGAIGFVGSRLALPHVAAVFVHGGDSFTCLALPAFASA
jgi:hypothetical protein